MNKIRVTRQDLLNISDVLKNFPEVNSVELIQEGNNGIGTTLDMKFTYKVNLVDCTLNVCIADESSW